MNQDKAREFFSAFYEGTLEPGLRQSLEQTLRTDPTLQSDYAAFVSTFDELGYLAGEEIEVPTYLSDRIATRLEEEMARRRPTTPVWSLWLRGVGFAGLGAAAIVGAVLSFHSSGKTAAANPFPVAGDDQPTFTANGGAVDLVYRPATPKTVVVSSAMNGRELQRFTVDGSSPSHSFENKLAGTALFQVQVLGDAPSFLLAMPGSSAPGAGSPSRTSTGTIKDFAVSVANVYRLPVVLNATDTGKRMKWDLEGLDPDSAAAAALAGEPYVVDERENGILYVSDR